MSVLHPSIEQLVREIVSVNHIWKQVRQLFGDDSEVAIAYRELKACHQARLLRQYAPEHVRLVIDSDAQGEALYSLHLKQTVADRHDAAHLPIRVAKEILTSEEIERFQQD